MCGRCIIFTYDEVLDIIQKIEVGVPSYLEPDWPARQVDDLPDSFEHPIGASDDSSHSPGSAQNAFPNSAISQMIPSLDSPSRFQNAFPNSEAPLIIPNFDTAQTSTNLTKGSLSARNLTWGFEESWKSGVVFNTRIESASKPTWKDSMEHRRCIIPVSAFYETHLSETDISTKTGKPIKRKYEFHVPDQEIILIGCIWKDDRFSMVTTEANSSMAPIHPRMPLIIRQEELPIWFSPQYQELSDRSSMPLISEPVYDPNTITTSRLF